MLFHCFVLAVGLLGVARGWDVAVTTENKINFYKESCELESVKLFEAAELSSLVYDAATDLLLLVDKLNANNSIFRLLSDNRTEGLVRKQAVTGLAFDPVTSTLFWTTDAGIMRMSLLEPRSNGYGDMIVSRAEGSGDFTDIAVDSCGGYIYWAENALSNSTIKHARLDGSEVSVVIGGGLYTPFGLAVDHGARRLYFVDDFEGVGIRIESSQLDGSDRRVVAKDHQQPTHIAVGDRNVYWGDELKNYVWMTPKNATQDVKAVKFCEDIDGAISKGLAVKYGMEAQSGNGHLCEKLKRTIATARHEGYINGLIADSLRQRNDACVHGAAHQTGCDCAPGYEGARCDQRTCDVCAARPALCNVADIKRCAPTTPAPIAPTTTSGGVRESVVLPPALTRTLESTETAGAPFQSVDNPEGVLDLLACEDPVKDYVIVSLAALCGLLCLAVAVLVIKVVQLKKRPRIKKRIIVNKNVTPLSARPEQCEITIENCCNMNICETVNRIEEWDD